MKLTKKVKKTELVEVTKDILCNMCGKSCDNEKRKNPKKEVEHPNYFGLVEVEIHGGYYSEVLRESSIRLSICEHCLGEKIFPLLKIPYEIKEDGNDYVSLPVNQEISKKQLKETKKDYIKVLIKMGHKKEDLEKMSLKELNDLYRK